MRFKDIKYSFQTDGWECQWLCLLPFQHEPQHRPGGSSPMIVPKVFTSFQLLWQRRGPPPHCLDFLDWQGKPLDLKVFIWLFWTNAHIGKQRLHRRRVPSQPEESLYCQHCAGTTTSIFDPMVIINHVKGVLERLQPHPWRHTTPHPLLLSSHEGGEVHAKVEN